MVCLQVIFRSIFVGNHTHVAVKIVETPKLSMQCRCIRVKEILKTYFLIFSPPSHGLLTPLNESSVGGTKTQGKDTSEGNMGAIRR